MTLPELTGAVRSSLRDHGNRVLLLDDITRLKMHRVDDQDTLDLMRAFMSMHTTLVLIGVNIPGSGLLREGRHDPRTGQWVFPPSHGRYGDDPSTQTERRFDLVHLEPFTYDTPAGISAWTTHLAGLQQELRLFRAAPDMLTAGTMPRIPVPPHQRRRRPARTTHRGRLHRSNRHRHRAADRNPARHHPDQPRQTTPPAIPAAAKSPMSHHRPDAAPATHATLSSTTPAPHRHGWRPVTRPLPRSLDPLPDESLVGFVLRLCHRSRSHPTSWPGSPVSAQQCSAATNSGSLPPRPPPSPTRCASPSRRSADSASTGCATATHR